MKYCKLLLLGVSSVVSAGPQGGVIVGQGSIGNPSAGQTVVTQQSARLAIDWQNFDLSSGETITFNQPSAGAIALNRIHSGTASTIDGSVTANGNIYILNPNGVIFGNNAQVNVGGLLVGDMDVDLEAFSKGQNIFADSLSGVGGVTNRGTITSTNGDVVMMGERIINSGDITVSGADVYLLSAAAAQYAPGSSQELVSSIPVAVTTLPEGAAWVENSGNIASTGGNIHIMSFHTADIDNALIANSGQIVASAHAGRGGGVFLEDTQLELQNIESLASTESSSVSFDSAEGREVEVDNVANYFSQCDESVDNNCRKEKAVQKFLQSLTVGGELPE